MRIHLTAATKMWLLTSLAFFYILIQYHVTNTWPLLISAGNSDIANQDGDLDPASRNKLWLRHIIGDAKMAEDVQNAIGDKMAKDMAYKIGQQLSQHSCNLQSNVTDLSNEFQPAIYIVTPTYRRPEQLAELTRLAQTLMQLPNIYWLLIEDAREKSEVVSQLLKRSGIRFIHLTGKYR